MVEFDFDAAEPFQGFAQLGLHRFIEHECEGLFLDGKLELAVFQAVKKLTDLVRERTGLGLDGNQLIDQACGGDNPLLRLNSLTTPTEKSEHQGFYFLLKGAISAFRNPTAHVIPSFSEQRTLSYLQVISLLMDMVLEAQSSLDDQLLSRVSRDSLFRRTPSYVDAALTEFGPAASDHLESILASIIRLSFDELGIAIDRMRFLYFQLLRRHGADTRLTPVAKELERYLRDDQTFPDAMQFVSSETIPLLSPFTRERARSAVVLRVSKGTIESDDPIDYATLSRLSEFYRGDVIQAARPLLLGPSRSRGA